MKSNMFFDKLKLNCKIHPEEKIISLCMNPYCAVNKLLCNTCLGQKLHECRNKMPIPKLYDFSDEKTYTQIQVEKSDSDRQSYHKNQEAELQQANERLAQLQSLKEKILAKFDQVIENQQQIVNSFIKQYSKKDETVNEKKQEQNTEEIEQSHQEETKQENHGEQEEEVVDEEEENRGKTLSQVSTINSSKDTQKALQHSLIKYLEQLQNDQDIDQSKINYDLCSLQLQNHNNMNQIKQKQSGHLVSKSADDLFQLELNALKQIGEFNEVLKIVHKYEQIQLEGYDSYSQTSIENMRNLYRNSNPLIKSQILTECDILSVDISLDRRFLIIGNGKPKYTVLVFDIQDANLLKPKLLISLPHTSAVQIVRISPNGLFFCSGCESSALRIYSTQQIVYKNKNNLLITLMDHQQSITGIQYSRDNKLLVTSSMDKSLIIYDCSVPSHTRALHKIKLEQPIISIDLSVRYALAVITADSVCTIYQNVKTQPDILYQIPLSGLLKEVKMSLNERFLCVNDYFSNCYIYDLTYQPPILYDTIQLSNTSTIAFHSDHSNILAIAKGDKNFNIYEISSNDRPTPSKLIYTSTDHNDTVLTLKFYNNFIISGGKDKKLLITEIF